MIAAQELQLYQAPEPEETEPDETDQNEGDFLQEYRPTPIRRLSLAKQRFLKSLENEILDAQTRNQVTQYLQRIWNTPVLTKAQEQKYFRTIETGNLAKQLLREIIAAVPDIDLTRLTLVYDLILRAEIARHKMYRHNTRLVVSIAKKYLHQGVPFMDLIQEGNLSLWQYAIPKFERKRDHKFSTYAFWWIRAGVQKIIMKQGSAIHQANHVFERIRKIKKAQRELLQINGEEATAQDIATHLKMHISKIEEALMWMEENNVAEFDAPIHGEDGQTLYDQTDNLSPKPETTANLVVLSQAIETALHLNQITERQRQIICWRFGLEPCPTAAEPTGATLEEVAIYYHVSRERIRQLEKTALEKLRDPHILAMLRGFLEDFDN